jgi:regulatory protein
MREHSKIQLINKLKNKGFEVDIINNVLEDLRNSGFQSDERYTEEYIRYRQNSGYGLEK